MLAYLLLIARMCIVSTQTALQKSFQLGFSYSLPNFLKYNMINGLFASAFLFALNGFQMNMNLPTFLYSLIFAALVGLSVVLVILALGRTSIPMVYIISTAGNVVLPTLFGIFVLGDEPTPGSIGAVVLLMVAVLLSYAKTNGKSTKSSLLIYLLFFLGNGAVIILTKLYSIELEAEIPRVCDEKSFYLATNMIVAAACILLAIFFILAKKATVKEIVTPFSPKQTLNICSCTVLSNIDSLVTIWAVGLMSLSIFSVTSSALIIIANTVLSVVFFKEKLAKRQWVATLLALVAIIVGA